MSTGNVAGVNFDNLPVPEVPVPAKYQSWLRFIYPAAAVVISLLAFSLLIVPTLNDAVNLKSETDNNGDKAKNLDQKLTTLKAANKDKLNDDLSKLEAALPSDKDVAGFLTNINQDASSAGASVSSVQLVPVSSVASSTAGAVVNTSKNVLEFNITVTGGYPNVRGFLTRIETTRRVMSVKTVGLTSSDNKLSASLVIDTYYEPLPLIVSGNSDSLSARTAAQDKIFSDIDNRTGTAPPITTPNASGRGDPFSGF
jgi:Tfp pilus assembly protein PilO